MSALGSASASAAPADGARFDGRWGIVLVCPKAPDGALAWSFQFPADVKDGVLHGERGTAGQPGWLTLDGRIQPDGAASLDARGLTGGAKFNVNQTFVGVAYQHDVTAHFDAARATGSWRAAQSNGQTRTCDFTFTKQ